MKVLQAAPAAYPYRSAAFQQGTLIFQAGQACKSGHEYEQEKHHPWNRYRFDGGRIRSLHSRLYGVVFRLQRWATVVYARWLGVIWNQLHPVYRRGLHQRINTIEDGIHAVKGGAVATRPGVRRLF
jgi:hypothetical protein